MASRTQGASPVTPLFDDLSTILPILPKKAYPRSRDDSDIALSSLDPDTSRLLPSRRRRHRVWVQGKLAPVTSVSVTNLRVPSAPSTPVPHTPSLGSRGPSPARFDRGVAGIVDRPRSAVEDRAGSDESEDERDTLARDTQLRGYGIGGAGNIRRATDVIHGPKGLASPPRRYDGSPSPDADKQRFSLRELLRRRSDKGKAAA
ncbi:hypothetical protein B0I35DRAFT_415750 [Stachybotrys elegans]|uniref:Uncharacterized protein n=1 Tax=Stachybotrys elegans TaxID=80388 RepID=A0A8K0T0G5_9HYPO|nr:hypothetical protein B0I35DRAFT_415750 [Stachybotrys elegans]